MHWHRQNFLPFAPPLQLNTGLFQSLAVIFFIFLQAVSPSTAEMKPSDKTSYWYSHDYPNPQTEAERCGRSPDHQSWLCDPDNFITEAEAVKLDELINSVHSETRCNCYSCITNSHGYLIMVGLMDAMYRDQKQMNSSESPQKLFSDAREFSKDLMERWGKKSKCKEYVFILFSRNDKVLYTLAQANAKKLLNQTMITKVQKLVSTYFGYKEGVAKGLTKMINYYKDIFLQKFKDPGPVHSLFLNQAEYSEDSKSEAVTNRHRTSTNLFILFLQISFFFILISS